MIPTSLRSHEPFLTAFAWSLLHFLWQGSILTGALALCLKISGKDSANRRYVLCSAALAGMILCPILTFTCLQFQARIMVSAGAMDIPPVVGSFVRFHREGSRGSQPILSWLVPAANQHLRPILALWSVGALALFGRIFLGLIEATRMKHRSTSRVPDGLQSLTCRLASRLSVTCPRMLTSSAVTTPIVVGWLRPVILVPANLLSDITQDHFEPVLAHELAHIGRRDYLLNVIQAVIEALLFFHPGVWWTSQRIRREREFCCDDLAVHVSGSPLIYAKALTSLEEQRSPAKHQLSLGASGGHLTMRISRLLKQHAARPATGIKIVLATLSGLTLTTLCVLSILATDHVKAQTVEPSSKAGVLNVSTAEGSKRPDMSCTFYDKSTHPHAGLCEESSKVTGPFYCKQTDEPMEKEHQSACEWKVRRLHDWERAQGLSQK